MSTALREAALASIASRLGAQLPTVPLERARRAEVDTDAEALPRLVLRGTGLQADEEAEPGRTHYTLGFEVAGYASGSTDLAAEQALSDLHAQVVAALTGWDSDAAGVGAVTEDGADFDLFDPLESSKPAGVFVARFTILAVGPAGGPWSF